MNGKKEKNKQNEKKRTREKEARERDIELAVDTCLRHRAARAAILCRSTFYNVRRSHITHTLYY